MAAQNNDTNNINVKENINNNYRKDKCRLYGERVETIKYSQSKCSKLAQNRF